MVYRFFINYLRLKLLRLILSKMSFKRRGQRTKKNLKSINVLSYAIELFAAFYFNKRKKK